MSFEFGLYHVINPYTQWNIYEGVVNVTAFNKRRSSSGFTSSMTGNTNSTQRFILLHVFTAGSVGFNI